MLKVLYATALGVVGAGIVHVLILFLLPGYSERDAWSRLSAAAEPYVTVRLNEAMFGGGAPALTDPFLATAACRFDLTSSTLHVRSEGSVPFWSMSIFDHNGLNVFSINDRAASDHTLDFVVVNPTQMFQLRQQLSEEFERSIFVEADVEEGIALVRVFVPDETWQGVADTFLDKLKCVPQVLE